MPSTNGLSKAALVIIVASLIPSLWVAVSALDMPQLGRFPDAGIYWVSAKSLADGAGYRILSLPGEPFQTKYPPLFPLLLAGVWKLDPNFPNNLRLATIVCWMAIPIYIFLAARLFRTMRFGSGHVAALCAALALNPYVLNYGITPMSELWFSCALLGCVLATRRAGEPGSALWMAAAAGVIGGLAYLTRSAGLPLLISCPLFFAIRKQYRRAALFACGMLPAIAAWTWWLGRHATHATDQTSLYYTNYAGFFLANFGWRDIPVLVWKNSIGLIAGAGDLIAVLRQGILPTILGLAAVVGAARMVRRTGFTAYHLYAAGLILMLLPWPLCAGDRYMRMLFPILPLLAAGLYDLLRDILPVARRWYDSDSAPRMASACAAGCGIAAVALLVSFGAVLTFLAVPASLARERRNLEADRTAYSWVVANLPPNTSFVTGADPVLHLFTGRKACTLIVSPRDMYFNPPQERDLGRTLAAFARANRLDYVFLNAGDSLEKVTGSPELKQLYRAGASIFRPSTAVP